MARKKDGKMVMKVSVLGPLRVMLDEINVTPSAPKLRSVLAVLALRHDRIVTVSMLMEELWEENVPASALATLQTYIYHLRKLLMENGGAVARAAIVTEPLGYILRLEEKLDKDVLDDLIEEGREALGRDNLDEASGLLTDALGLISGPPLSDVDAGPVLTAHIADLRESILRALELQITAEIRLGRHAELVSRLKALTAEYPFHESFYARLMIVLQRTGRRAEALEVFQQLRNTLVSELGIEPSGELCEIQQTLLAGNIPPLSVASPPPPARLMRPAQLPPDVADFVGRGEALRSIRESVTREEASAVRLVSITGMAGVGKTALAVHAAHSIRHHFRDGQFYAHLRGSEDEPADPFPILGACLRAAGLSDRQIPRDVAERTQLFRSWTAERKVLVVLDDAVNYQQAAPLLPGGAGCCVLVTSRSLLPGLVGAHMIELDTPDLDECLSLLCGVVGRTRIGAEDLDVARTIVQLCGHLPLAIRAVGTRLLSAPRGYPVEKLLSRLADDRRRMRELQFGDLDVSARLRPTYRRLGTAAREVLQSLVSAEVPVFTLPSAATLLGMDTFRLEPVVDRLMHERFLRPIDSDSVGEPLFSVSPLVSMFVQTEEPVADWGTIPSWGS
jgi:DNA-binding SARP family transcriptional activator